MLRTQISLTTEERRVLDAEAVRSGRSLSALIRAAVDSMYGSPRPSDDNIERVRRSFGSWTDREDDGAQYVETLRSGSRLENSSS